MSIVGLRELKNKLSKYVARARSGESVSITNRGQIVAELSPAKRHARTGEPTVTIEDLRRKGIVYGGGPNKPDTYPAMPRALKQSAASLLDEERGSH